MPQYKLIYFDAKGRGEGLRWILVQAGADWEDVRVTQETWPPMKPGMAPKPSTLMVTMDN